MPTVTVNLLYGKMFVNILKRFSLNCDRSYAAVKISINGGLRFGGNLDLISNVSIINRSYLFVFSP